MVKHMTEFLRRTENQFRFTWEALVSNRLAIQLLSRGSTMYNMGVTTVSTLLPEL